MFQKMSRHPFLQIKSPPLPIHAARAAVPRPVLPVILSQLQRISRAQAGKEAQCLNDGFRREVFKCNTAKRSRCFTGMLRGQMGRSQLSVLVSLLATLVSCQNVPLAGNTTCSWQRSIGVVAAFPF